MRKQGCKKWALYVPQLVALLLVFNLNLNATAFSQHQRLNLKLKDATLEEFISAIKRQCDVGFIYDYNKTIFHNYFFAFSGLLTLYFPFSNINLVYL